MSTQTPTAPELAPFAHQKTALLTSYKRDGTPVRTPVTIVVNGDRAFMRSYDKSGKAKRMRNNPRVEIAPSTFRGKATGAGIAAHSRLLAGDEAARAAGSVARRQPVLQGMLVPLTHRLKRYETLHYELVPIATNAGEQAGPTPDA